MTSDEILATEAIARSTNGWLREVAYQLALLNEKPAVQPAPKPLPSAADMHQRHPARR